MVVTAGQSFGSAVGVTLHVAVLDTAVYVHTGLRIKFRSHQAQRTQGFKTASDRMIAKHQHVRETTRARENVPCFWSYMNRPVKVARPMMLTIRSRAVVPSASSRAGLCVCVQQ